MRRDTARGRPAVTATADRWSVAVGRQAGHRLALDYYVVLDRRGGTGAAVEAIVAEEFVRAGDGTTVGLRGAGWTPASGRWWNSAPYSRAMRTDPGLRARVVPVDRTEAEAVHRRLGGGPLPDEPVLRTRLAEVEVFPATAPLRLGPADAPEGCHERRVYRVLFAGDLPAQRVAELAERWRPAGGAAAAGVPSAGRRRVHDDRFAWVLRRVGGGVAWAVDVTADLATADDRTVGPLLHELTSAVRLCGLVPVTTERFA
ncbi:hypothetical protein [Micromonospora globbae]|uniref:DUF317 domain-containing protein n=1 Tax=Micromonospora globbae TaxID=1894969 RepID=A0ABZ1SDZ5_9ACTN|nr:hypothetical protein [Micromonospora globbae]